MFRLAFHSKVFNQIQNKGSSSATKRKRGKRGPEDLGAKLGSKGKVGVNVPKKAKFKQTGADFVGPGTKERVQQSLAEMIKKFETRPVIGGQFDDKKSLGCIGWKEK